MPTRFDEPSPPPDDAVPPDDQPAQARPGRVSSALSLELKLPLLIAGLLLVVVAAYSWQTFREVRRSALSVASERLQKVSQQLAKVVERQTLRPNAALRRAADDPVVRDYVASGGKLPDSLVRLALQRLATATDSVPNIELLAADGTRLLAVGNPPPADERGPPLRTMRATEADSVLYGPLQRREGHVVISATAPITQGRRRLGYVVRWSHLGGTPESRRQLTEVVGSGSNVYLANLASDLVVDLTGAPVALPLSAGDTSTVFEYARAGNHRFIAGRAHIEGTPWAMIVEFARDDVLAGSRSLFRRLALAAILLVVIGGAGGWALSRRMTRPLGQLTDAAEAIAAGDYSRRVPVEREDELGRLAESFNFMSAQIAETRERLEAARGASDAANQAKSHFLATMSHEIRTPLNAILGYTELLRSGIIGELQPQQQQFMERTQASGRHLLALINDVLDLSKIEADSMEVHREPAPLHSAVSAALTLVEPQATARGLTTTNDCTAESDLIYLGDEARVEQILVNLLSNAVKFTEPGGTISVTCGRASAGLPETAIRGTGPLVFVSVEDTGIGIRPERMDAIWDSFVQAEMGHTRSYGGTGLGLTISRRLARLMSGDLTVRSTVGSGSTFTLWLPAGAPDAAPVSFDSERLHAVP